MRKSPSHELSDIKQEIEKVRLMYKPDSGAFIEPLWRMRMDRLMQRKKLLHNRVYD
jgi:hypothetical protein